MVRQPIKEAKSVAKLFDAEKLVMKIGLDTEDYHFLKKVGKALLCTYAVLGGIWVWNEAPRRGWWTLNPPPKERRKLPYPGDEAAMKEFVSKGGVRRDMNGAKGGVELDKDAVESQKELEDHKFEEDALKLWSRLRGEVVSELQEKGFKVA